MGFDTLPPWDANAWFDTPKLVSVNTPGSQTVQIIGADSNRVGLIISSSFGGGNDAYVGPDTAVAAGIGIHLTTGRPFIEITHREWGPLTQAAWYGFGNGLNTSFTCLPLTLRDWPESDPNAGMDVRDYLDYIAEMIKGMRNGHVAK